MDLTSHLSAGQREHVERRLHSSLMAWLTTVRANAQPETVPVWFYVREDETVLLYSRPDAVKLRNITLNPRVTLVLDVTDIGRDVVRIDGIAQIAREHPLATEVPGYLAKYLERMSALFGSPERFAQDFSVAIVIVPATLRADVPG
ncbi:MAG TPA: TIGR03667 family PPOX class F420-dependent oxidoreductase [Acidimicrobiales bacterium]|nr:TIGR03667 family PPOX class F420-dependent oxidoreductase [Acidimicrobiales bacterium]